MTEENRKLVKEILHFTRLNDRAHRTQIESQVNRLGIHRTQHMFLMFISRCPEPPSQNEIAGEFHVSSSAASVTLKKMENAGLIERRRVGEDSRTNRISITEAGLEMVEKTKKLFDGVDSKMFEGFSGDELLSLLRYLTKINENCSNNFRNGGQE